MPEEMFDMESRSAAAIRRRFTESAPTSRSARNGDHDRDRGPGPLGRTRPIGAADSVPLLPRPTRARALGRPCPGARLSRRVPVGSARDDRRLAQRAGGIFKPHRVASEDVPTTFMRRELRERSYALDSPATRSEPASPSAPRRDRLRRLLLRGSRGHPTRALPDVWRQHVARRSARSTERNGLRT